MGQHMTNWKLEGALLFPDWRIQNECEQLSSQFKRAIVLQFLLYSPSFLNISAENGVFNN